MSDYKGKCGSCKFFDFRAKNGVLKKWGGRCNNINRKMFHDASQKGCKLYQAESEDKE